MKILITGGNGYLGARLSLFFANKGHEVIPVCYPYKPKEEKWINKMSQVIVGDIRKDETIINIADIAPDIIIHLISLDQSDSEKEVGFVNEVNVLPTWRLLDLCTKRKLKKFIYFSTVHVYGSLPNKIITENYPVQPKNIYGLTHSLSENISEHFNRTTSTNIISIRLTNSYGSPIFFDNNCWWLAINDLCRNAVLHKKIRLLSDGTPQRDFIHGDDVSEAINVIINFANKNNNNKYNISSSNTLTIGELALIVQDEYKKRYDKKILIYTPQGAFNQYNIYNQTRKYTISNDKIKALGFSPAYSVRKGINELFTYFDNNMGKYDA